MFKGENSFHQNAYCQIVLNYSAVSTIFFITSIEVSN